MGYYGTLDRLDILILQYAYLYHQRLDAGVPSFQRVLHSSSMTIRILTGVVGYQFIHKNQSDDSLYSCSNWSMRGIQEKLNVLNWSKLTFRNIF